MSSFRDKDLGDRLSAAENARKAMVERFRAKPGADDPAVAERAAARQAVSAARNARLSEREVAKLAKTSREAAERETRETARREQEVREAVARTERETALEGKQKAARDARYAARKART